MTVFALSMSYLPSDISLVVSHGLLELLFKLCRKPKTLSFWQQLVLTGSDLTQLTVILEVASLRLLQVLTMTTGYVGCLSPQHFFFFNILEMMALVKIFGMMFNLWTSECYYKFFC